MVVPYERKADIHTVQLKCSTPFYLSLCAILCPLSKVANKAIIRYGSQPDGKVPFDQVRFWWFRLYADRISGAGGHGN